MKRNPERPSGADASMANEHVVDATDAAREVKRALEGGKAAGGELAQKREHRIDRMLENDPDWPARQAAWKRLCERLGVAEEEAPDARRMEHEHWDALQRRRHGPIGSKLRDLWAILNDPEEF